MMTAVKRLCAKMSRLKAMTFAALAALPLLSLGPATAISPPEHAGYLLYPQSNLCALPSQADAHEHSVNPHRFRPRLTENAVLPLSAGSILASSLSRQNGG